MQKSSSQNRLCRPKVSKNRLPARIRPKRIVSAHSQKRNSIAGPGPSKMRNVSSKRLPARIWPKRAVSAHCQKRKSIAGPKLSKKTKFEFQKGSRPGFNQKRAVLAHSQKRHSIAGPGPSKMANLSSKRVPGQDLTQKGRFGSFPEKKFNSRTRAVQNDKCELQKAAGQDLTQKGPSWLIPRRNIQ